MPPRFQEFFGQLTAGLDEEGGGADGEVANLEGEDLLGRGVEAEALEDALERFADDGLSEGARRVVRAAAAAFVGGLEDQSAFGHRGRGGVACDLAFERGEQIVSGSRRFEGFLGVAGKLLVSVLGEPLGAVFGLDRKSVV